MTITHDYYGYDQDWGEDADESQCSGFGCADGCADCAPLPRYTRCAGYDWRISHGNRVSLDCWKDAAGVPHWFGVGIDPNDGDANDDLPF